MITFNLIYGAFYQPFNNYMPPDLFHFYNRRQTIHSAPLSYSNREEMRKRDDPLNAKRVCSYFRPV